MATKRFEWKTNGRALDGNVIAGERYRFTVLTSRLIRLEYAADGVFEDRASQTVFYRDFPQAEYTAARQDGVLTVTTPYLTLSYREDAAFAEDTLTIKMDGAVWKYGHTAPQLGGTARTLDCVIDRVPLADGVCSRAGYTVVDDSHTLLLEDGWFAVRRADTQDLYFFGYGHDYTACIADYYRLTGVPPLLPDYALGNWWSRYYRYSQQEYCDLIERFEREDIPFSVSVVDMDWHGTETPAEARIDDTRFWNGWTGYTWNEELFPDYKAFLGFLHDHHLKTALNLHPSNGVGCHEAMYPEMATACGVDPASKKLVKLDLLNPEFMAHYFDILHHPYEADGVDFWWMDWQQGTDYWWVHDEDHPASELEQMDPLWILNHLHILDISRNGKRPMFFSRYCGLGAHRYPVGFSGDTILTWESLRYQPYFTANASNAGYGWWSHDIGGHMRGYRDDEMTVRWMQLGVLSPINRLHASNNPFSGKEPWNLSREPEMIADEWLRLRHRLFPYLYTMNYRTHTCLEPMIRPMYYAYPERDEAYRAPDQYWFGTQLMAAPITEKNDPTSLLGAATVWFPEGLWFDVFNGFCYTGNDTRRVHRSLSQTPLFAKAGAIVPLEDYVHDNTLGRKADMTVYVFPGADNRFELYEDAGDGSEWESGACATTAMTLTWGDEARFTIHAAEGDTSLLPEDRRWTVKLRGFAAGATVSATVDGQPLPVDAVYERATSTLTVVLPYLPVTQTVELTVSADGTLVTDNAAAKERIYNILLHAQTGMDWKMQVWDFVCEAKQLVPRNEDRFSFSRDQSATMDAIYEMLILLGKLGNKN